MALSEERAFLLRYRPLSEERLWLELFGQSLGKIVAIGRKPSPPPYWTELSLTLTRRGGELFTLRGWDEGEATLLRGRRVIAAFYLNELLIYLLPREEPMPQLFETYRKTLSDLSGDLEAALRRFELELLKAIGYDLPLQEEFQSELRYRYIPEGGFEPSPVGEVSGRTLKALRERRLEGEEVRGEAKRLLRRVIAHHLGSRRLRSRELWRG